LLQGAIKPAESVVPDESMALEKSPKDIVKEPITQSGDTPVDTTTGHADHVDSQSSSSSTVKDFVTQGGNTPVETTTGQPDHVDGQLFPVSTLTEIGSGPKPQKEFAVSFVHVQ
jgi:hypothetical protein